MKKKLVFKNEIYIKHKQLINNLKKKIKKYNKQEFFPHHDIPTYFSPFYNCSGLFSIQKILNLKTNFFSNIFYILKDFFYSFRYYELLKIFGDDQKIKKRNVVFTWGIKKNFLKNGSYYDKYLNINSRKDKNTAWVIIYLDEGIPKNFDKNIFIIQPKKKIKLNITLFFKVIFPNIKYIFKDYLYFLFSISSHNYLSKKIINLVKDKISKEVRSFLIMYESQPFQNELINFAKKNNIKSAGYIHFPPLALPVHMLKKKNSPEKLFVNGIDQKKCFLKLGWKKKDLILIKSSRFLKRANRNFSNKIYLPISIKSKDVILKNLEYLLKVQKLNFSKFTIQNHPASLNSITHKDLIFKIEKLKRKYINLNLTKKKNVNYSLFIGTTGAIIEALERKVKVIQITEIPIMDCYSNYFWGSIRIKKINKFIYLYTLSKKNNLINFGTKLKNLDIYFNNF